MSLAKIKTPESIRKAMQEFDELGRDCFLEKYGFGHAREFFLEFGGKHYDSKAIVGVAHKYEFPDEGILSSDAFSGGEITVKHKLEKLGYHVVPRGKQYNDNSAVQTTDYWTFFCNPAKWAIDQFLEKNIEYDDYMVTEWQSDWFKPGQLGVVRVGLDRRTKKQLAGKQQLHPGVYAIVQVLGQARKRGKTTDPFWSENAPRMSERLVVDIRYLKNLLLHPLRISDLKNDSEITDKYLLNGFQSATMPLSPNTFNRVLTLTNSAEQISENIEVGQANSVDEIVALQQKYLGASPEVKEAVSRRIERGAVAKRLKKAVGYKCVICEGLGLEPIGFLKKDGEPYIEVHHVIAVSELRQGSLAPSNLITVCANHHRQLHYGDSELLENNSDEFVFLVDGKTVRVKNLMLSSKANNLV